MCSGVFAPQFTADPADTLTAQTDFDRDVRDRAPTTVVLAGDNGYWWDRNSTPVRILSNDKRKRWSGFYRRRSDRGSGPWAGGWTPSAAGLIDDERPPLATRVGTATPHIPEPFTDQVTSETRRSRSALGHLTIVSVRAAHPPGVRDPILHTAVGPARTANDDAQAMSRSAFPGAVILTPFIFNITTRQGTVGSGGETDRYRQKDTKGQYLPPGMADIGLVEGVAI